ncbi:3'-5' exonuclease [Mesorhizobium sp. M1233]|uniref:3'-5' exonuclease n=1 Tax=Mesorhizobium sp. M1233 TaxID=2957072 RepID=UPI00333B63E2
MPKYAIFDTETTGLFLWRDEAGNPIPADAEGQPRLAHIGMILLDDNLIEERSIDLYVKPDGWKMSPGAQAVNGLTDEFLTENGFPIADVMGQYASVIDEGYVLVAFNSQFDTKMGRAELRRCGMDDRFERTPNICVMKASTDVCQIQRMRPGGGFKQPKLSEACAFFGIVNDAAHSAGGDARAALEVFRRLHALGALPEPQVHYAKNHPDQAAA